MIIRCPQCEHSRNVNESKIPATAELATCPKCKHRFRFRALESAAEAAGSLFSPQSEQSGGRQRPAPAGGRGADPVPAPPGPEVRRPQGAVREAAARQGDIWDAVDILHHRWQAQMDQHVTEVITPVPATAPEPADAAADPATTGAETAGAEDANTAVPAPAAEKKFSHGISAALEKATAALKIRLDSDPAHVTEKPDASGPEPDLWALSGSGPEGGRQTPPASGPPVYPYGENGPRPEERVERDMRLLRETPEARPVRNLGSLREHPDEFFPAANGEAPDFAEADEDGAESAVPWENPAAHGWVRAFMGTLHGVMFQGPDFFSRISPGGSLGPGYLFFLIMGYVTILGCLLWSQALAALLPGAFQGLTSRVALPVLLLLAPIALGLMLLFVVGCIRVTLLLFAPEKSLFPLVYKVVSYSMAPFVLSIVPFVGPAVGAAWFIVALIAGCRNALKLSWKLSVFAPLPPAVMLLGGLVWYFL